MVRFNMFKVSGRRTLFFATATFLFGLAIWWLNSRPWLQNFWQGYLTDSDIGTFFCEYTDMSKIVRQPVNTFSNLAYLLPGIAILRRGWKDQSKRNKYNIISANPFYSIMLGGILLYIFIASTFFHSSLIGFASKLDFSAVYALSLYPLMYFTHRVWLLSIGLPSNTKHTKSTITVITAFTIMYILLTFGMPHGMENYVVLGIIITIALLGLIVERYDSGRTNHRYLLTGIACIAFAVMWFAFDIYKILCLPDSYVQPHSLWHLFAGLSTFYFYMYIRSEKNKI
ncbi:MAG: hypothetical protein RLZZ367_686 [Bacteroidota bacterium]